jgi:hypothetical protein
LPPPSADQPGCLYLRTACCRSTALGTIINDLDARADFTDLRDELTHGLDRGRHALRAKLEFHRANPSPTGVEHFHYLGCSTRSARHRWDAEDADYWNQATLQWFLSWLRQRPQVYGGRDVVIALVSGAMAAQAEGCAAHALAFGRDNAINGRACGLLWHQHRLIGEYHFDALDGSYTLTSLLCRGQDSLCERSGLGPQPLTAFTTDPGGAAGYDSRCKTCNARRAFQRRHGEHTAEEYEAAVSNHGSAVHSTHFRISAVGQPERKCTQCGETSGFKVESECFSKKRKDAAGHQKYQPICKECHNEGRKAKRRRL